MTKTLKGTQTFHRIVPISPNRIRAYKTSDSVDYVECHLGGQKESESIQISIGNYLACRYDRELWLGIVMDFAEEFNDYEISFLNIYKKGTNKYCFPDKTDVCWVQTDDIICRMDAPNITPGVKIIYSFNSKQLATAQKKLNL